MNRRLRIAIQRDPIEGSRPGETTHLLAQAAQARGHSLWYHTPADLRFQEGHVVSRARSLRYEGMAFHLGDPSDLDLAEMDVVLLRQDPPLDMAWLTTTWLLDLLPSTTRVINSPRSIRETPEKLLPLALPHLSPPSLVSANPACIRDFRAIHGDIVIKPLFDKAGAGIFFLDRDDPNFDVVVESWVPALGEPVLVQRYQPEAQDGSVRVMVVEGVPIGSLRSVPREGVRRGNMDRSARVEATTLSGAQADCVAQVCRLLLARGVVFAGIDLVGPWLLEVNVTSPGGAIYYDRVYAEPFAPKLWEVLERGISQTGAQSPRK